MAAALAVPRAFFPTLPQLRFRDFEALFCHGKVLKAPLAVVFFGVQAVENHVFQRGDFFPELVSRKKRDPIGKEAQGPTASSFLREGSIPTKAQAEKKERS